MSPDTFIDLINSENLSNAHTHVLECGLSDAEYYAWKQTHASLVIPSDFLSFMRRHNGFRLYPMPSNPKGRVHLLSLKDIQYAPRLLFGDNTSCDMQYPETAIALTDDPDSAQHLILDTETNQYYNVDPIVGLEEDAIVGNKWQDALDWICKRASLGSRLDGN